MTDYSKDAWKYFEYGKTYNNNLTPNQYKLVETNTEFFAGNQWIHMPDNEAMRRLARPTFNIIKRVTSMFVANLTSSGTAINFEPLPYQDDQEAAWFATSEVRSLLEKFKIDYRIRDALFDGAITGDYCAHFYWNPNARPYGGAFEEYSGEIEMEMVDGINVMFGNPNITDVEKQPYIIIVGRDTVENLKEEAEYWRRAQKLFKGGNPESCPAGAPASELADISKCRDKSGAIRNPYSTEISISPDSEYASYLGNTHQPEIRGDDDKSSKALYIYLYTKVNGTVHVTKATRTADIFNDIDTGLSRYPVAWGNWQKQKNQYHGRALVTEVIPNQIFINQMMAMVFRHLQTQAFPTKVFNADVLPNITNEVGTAIGVRNLMPGQTLGSVITTLPASDMSGQIIQAIELCMQYTKECLGATDAQLGNADATNTSALMVLQNASEVPLENTRAGLHEWLEDIGGILLDMMGTYYGTRPIMRDIEIEIPMLGADGNQLMDPATGAPASVKRTEKILQEYDFSKFKKLWFNVSVDVGATSYYSEIASFQTLDNLRKEGVITFTEYLERIPNKLFPGKQEIIDDLKKKEGLTDGQNVQVRQAAPAPKTSPVRGKVSAKNSDAARALSNMPQTLQGIYSGLPDKAQRTLRGLY